MNRPPGHDVTKLQRALLTGFFILVTVALVRFGFTQGQPILGLLIPLIGIASWFIGRPAILFCTVLFAENARLLIPGITATLGVSELFQVLLIGWMLLDISVRHQKRPFSFRKNPDLWMIIFALNMFMIMQLRGSGFAMLGGSVYGGTAYVSMFLSIVFYFASTRIHLCEQHVKTLLWMVLAGALVFSLVQIAATFFPSGFGWMTKFVGAQAEKIIEEQSREGGVVRWTAFSLVSYALIPIAYILCRRKSTRLVLIVLAFILVGMTGARSRIFQVGVLVFLAGIYFSKNRIKTLTVWALAGLLVFGFLMIAAPMLPRAVQRSVSSIPFIPVDAEIAERAAVSSDWRFDLWRDYCIPNIPKYLLVGRGIAHDITGFAWLQSKWYGSSEFFYFMGRYHSGPLTLLLDLGLAGFVSFTMFFLLVLKDSWSTVKKYAFKCDTLVKRYYVYLTLSMSFEVFNYYFIFGDIRGSLFRMLITAVQLRILKKNFLMEALPEAGMSEVRSQRSGVSSATQQLTTGNQTPVNRWARTSQGSDLRRLL